MVDVPAALAEAIGMKKKPKPNEYEEVLCSFDRKHVGPNARFEVPLNSRQNLAKIAGMLRALAAHYDRLKDDSTLKDKQALYDAGEAARMVAKEFRKLEEKVGRSAWDAD